MGLGETLPQRSGELSSEQVAELGARVEANAARLNEMISRLLDFSRLQTSQRRLRTRTVDLAPLVAAAVERMTPRLGPREVAMDIDPTAPPGTTRGWGWAWPWSRSC